MGGNDPVCTQCEGPVSGYSGDIRLDMLRRGLCFTCRFWVILAESAKDADRVVVGQYHYTIDPDVKTRRRWQGHGGRRFNILFNDGRTVSTTNLWAQGKVPERFKAMFPDNAVFVELLCSGCAGAITTAELCPEGVCPKCCKCPSYPDNGTQP